MRGRHQFRCHGLAVTATADTDKAIAAIAAIQISQFSGPGDVAAATAACGDRGGWASAGAVRTGWARALDVLPTFGVRAGRGSGVRTGAAAQVWWARAA